MKPSHREEPHHETRADLHHKAHSPKHIRFAVVTVSDTRTPENDTSGTLLRRLVHDAGYEVTQSAIVRDDPADVARVLDEACSRHDVDLIVLNGGTGISSRDGTDETVWSRLEKRLNGFGELFRFLSYQHVGSAAMLSRAVGGLSRGKVVFSIPGSPQAAEVAMRELILPEAGHLMFEVRR